MSLYNKPRIKNNKWFALIGSIDKAEPFLIETAMQNNF
jgi:hypothetical protein